MQYPIVEVQSKEISGQINNTRRGDENSQKLINLNHHFQIGTIKGDDLTFFRFGVHKFLGRILIYAIRIKPFIDTMSTGDSFIEIPNKGYLKRDSNT